MPLADIRRVAALAGDAVAGCDDVNSLVDAHLARVRAKLGSLRALEAQLVRLRAECVATPPGAACRIVDALQQAARDEGCACHPAVAGRG